MKKVYTVTVYKDHYHRDACITEWRNEKGELHREDGPAVEWVNGGKSWYINGEKLTEEQWRARVNPCADKVVIVDGKRYKLTPI